MIWTITILGLILVGLYGVLVKENYVKKVLGILFISSAANLNFVRNLGVNPGLGRFAVVMGVVLEGCFVAVALAYCRLKND